MLKTTNPKALESERQSLFLLGKKKNLKQKPMTFEMEKFLGLLLFLNPPLASLPAKAVTSALKLIINIYL